MKKVHKAKFLPRRGSSMRMQMLTLSFVSLAGMLVLMAIIIWQMHGNIVSERKHAVHSQVISALGMVEEIYTRQKTSDLPEEEAKQMALSNLRAMGYPDSGYFWVINSEGVMLMHPYDRELIGKSMLELVDANGQFFVKKFIIAARSGGGFVDYDWTRPIGGEPASKTAYVVPFKPWGWVIGSGLYVDDVRTDSVQHIAFGAIFIFVLFGLNMGVSLYLSRRFMNEFRDNAIHDDLTNLFTRNHLHEVGSRMMGRFNGGGEPPLAAIFLDIDHFKQVNDNYGHKVGDVVLVTICNMLIYNLRPNELAFRYGGEELAVLLHASEENCFSIAERIRAAVKKHEFDIAGNKFNITISAGIAVARRDEPLTELLRRADQCMYIAKKQGRDCTVMESELDDKQKGR